MRTSNVKPNVKIKNNIEHHNDFDFALKFNKRSTQTETKEAPKQTQTTRTNPYTNKDAPWVNNVSKILFDSTFLPEINKFQFEKNHIGINVKHSKELSDVNTLINKFDNVKLNEALKTNDIIYFPIVHKTNQEEEIELNEKRVAKTKEITNNPKFTESQKYVKIKDLNEKIDKQIKMIGKVIVNKRYRILFNENQKKIVLNWMKICDHFYNYCVDSHNSGDKRFNGNSKGIKAELFGYYFKHILIESNKAVIDNDIQLESLKKIEKQVKEKKKRKKRGAKEDVPIVAKTIKYKIINLFDKNESFSNEIKDISDENKLLKKISKPIPYDVITDELLRFCSNLKSCKTNIENGHQTHFEMKRKDYNRNYRSILLPKKAISKKGIFYKILGEMGDNYNDAILNLLDENKINSDCRLTYDRTSDVFTILFPTIEDKIIVQDREKFAALDPGEKIFQAFFGEKSCGIICENIRELILKFRGRIDKLKSILSGGKNRKGKKLKRRKLLRKRMHKLEKKMSNIIDDMHKKTALFLCNNYDKVLIPQFYTQDMATTRKLGRKVNYSLLRLGHCKFKQHLKTKGQQYGCKIYDVTEEYTSQCCGKCGKVTKVYDDRVKTCTMCKTKIDRDLNGSRNIFVKNYDCILDVSKVETNANVSEDVSKKEESKTVKKARVSRKIKS